MDAQELSTMTEDDFKHEMHLLIEQPLDDLERARPAKYAPFAFLTTPLILLSHFDLP
jgi:hypothetical protein